MISSSIIAYYEDTLQALFTLAFFIPLLIGTGGNTGAQSATLMVRALATDDLDIGDWSQTLLKEIEVGGLLGFTMAVATFPLGFWQGELPVAIIVSATMITLMTIANLVGMLLPFILTRFKMDPTVASSPLITTVVDALGLLIYFIFATFVIRFFT